MENETDQNNLNNPEKTDGSNGTVRLNNDSKPDIKDKSDDKSKKDDKIKKRKKRKNAAAVWVVIVFILTLVLSFSFSLVSEMVIGSSHIIIAFIVLFILIFISLFFDIIAVAFISCDITPFYAMAARKVKGAKRCIELLKKSDRVSSVCGDIIGDICGIVSGSAGAALAIMISANASGTWRFLSLIIISSIIASLTVGGKSIGKVFAIKYSQKIVHSVGKFLSVFGKK